MASIPLANCGARGALATPPRREHHASSPAGYLGLRRPRTRGCGAPPLGPSCRRPAVGTAAGGYAYGRAEEAGRQQMLQQQVFELKQRLVEAEVKRQAAEKAAAAAQREQFLLRSRVSQMRWLLVLLGLLLLGATATLTWAALEAPPLGLIPLGSAGSGAGPGLGGALVSFVERLASWIGRCVAAMSGR